MFKNSVDIINFVDQLKNTEANTLKFLFFITRSILVQHLIYRSKAITSTKYNQIGYAIACASDTSKRSEKNYCQLQKEILFIVSACEKVLEYFQFTMIIYHWSQYLSVLLQKLLQFQRFLLRHQKCNFQMNYIHSNKLTVVNA